MKSERSGKVERRAVMFKAKVVGMGEEERRRRKQSRDVGAKWELEEMLAIFVPLSLRREWRERERERRESVCVRVSVYRSFFPSFC